MTLSELLIKRRSIRRYQQIPVSDEQLKELTKAAVLAPCAVNRQALSYIIVRTPAVVKQVLELTRWAAAVQPKRTPVWGKTAPSAFIAVCSNGDNALEKYDATDASAAIMCMTLRAVELGLGTCWLGAFDQEQVRTVLSLGTQKIVYLLAVGVPAEEPVCEEIGVEASRKYYLDESDQLHVPKIRSEEITRFV